MTTLVAHVDRVLAAAEDRGGTARPRDWVFAAVAGGVLYGAVMGGFGGLTQDRWPQLVYSAVKIPLLIFATTALTLPSYFVLNTLAGLRADFPAVVRAVAATQGAVGIVLAALAPLTAVWYLSTANYQEAIAFNGFMVGAAGISAQWVLRTRYAPLIRRNPRHRVMLRVWVVLYGFVGIQMSWTLRPFVGEPGLAPTFVRADAWGGNAYVQFCASVWTALR